MLNFSLTSNVTGGCIVTVIHAVIALLPGSGVTSALLVAPVIGVISFVVSPVLTRAIVARRSWPASR